MTESIRQAQHSCPATTLQVDVHPIDWIEWQPIKGTAMYTSSRYLAPGGGLLGGPSHDLTEMGETSNGYKYSVYYNSSYLLRTTIRPSCCGCIAKCPVGRNVVPTNPCRQHLRYEAKRMAYELWVQYMRDLGAANVPANAGDTET